MSKIVIGKMQDLWGKDAKLDVKAFLRTHLLIWASTGGGKSFLIRRIAEQLVEKIPVIIVDREGEFSSLREKFNFVLVGPGGETPADPRTAKMVAIKLLELHASAVCDLFELGIDERSLWVKNFFEALSSAPKKLWGPRAIILDEAHSFAPEKGQGDSQAYGAVTDFVGIARKRGFGTILATQRLSKLSKNATAEMYNQAAGPTATQSDRERAAYEMGTPKKEVAEFSDALRRLNPGNFFFQGRAISMDRILVKVGPVSTTHAEAGSMKYKAKLPPAPREIKALLPKLADLPKEAEKEATTIAGLKKQIRELKSKNFQARHGIDSAPAPNLKSNKKLEKDTLKIAREVEPMRHLLKMAYGMLNKVLGLGFHGAALTEKEIIEVMKVAAKEIAARADAKLSGRQEEYDTIWREVVGAAGEIKRFMKGKNGKISIDLPITLNDAVTATSPGLSIGPGPVFIRKKSDTIPLNGYIGGPHRKILKALGELRSIGRTEAPREMVAGWAGYSPKGGAFGNPLGRLSSLQLVYYPSPGTVALTDSGLAEIPSIDPPDQEEIRRRILDICSGPERKILTVLLDNGSTPISKSALAEKSGYSEGGGAFGNPLGALRTNGFCDYPSKGMVKCADWLFIEG